MQTEKLAHIKKYYANARSRAKATNLPFNLTISYLVSIAHDECPIFKTPLTWGVSKMGKGKTRADTPQLDRIIPEQGYVIGNVAFLSGKANKMKDNGTMQEHYAIADWIWEQTHAKEKSTTPVSTGTNNKSNEHTLDSAVLTAGSWKNSNDINNYFGAVQGENSYRSAKEGSGNSMGARDAKVGAPKTPKGGQGTRHPSSTVNSAEEFFERVRRQSRELDMAIRSTLDSISKPRNR